MKVFQKRYVQRVKIPLMDERERRGFREHEVTALVVETVNAHKLFINKALPTTIPEKYGRPFYAVSEFDTGLRIGLNKYYKNFYSIREALLAIPYILAVHSAHISLAVVKMHKINCDKKPKHFKRCTVEGFEPLEK